MVNANITTQRPERHGKQVAPVDLLGHDPVLHPLTPLDRLQLAAQGLSDVEPQDVTALVAEVVTGEAAVVNKMAGEVETMRQFMFTQGSGSAVPPEAILSLIERMSALHRQRQSEFLRSAELLHRLASPPVRPTVNVLSVSRA
jgi:hypothetical protein